MIIIEAGMVIALEPKIGLVAYGMPGVEDTYEINEKGASSITGTRPEFDIICINC